MSCYEPVYGVRIWDEELQKWYISFKSSDLNQTDESQWYAFPCRKCVGCQIDKSRDWGLRGYHESQYHKESMFLTLTYRDSELDDKGGLWRIDVQNFNKRLRKYFSKHHNKKVRVMYCGEYGKKGTKRPHFHIIVFGACFDDLIQHRFTKSKWSHIHGQCGYFTYRSPQLEKLWKYGYSEVGAVTEQSIKYVARYVTKKQYGADAEEHYEGRRPEFFGTSTRPGIGFEWFLDFHKDLLKGYIRDSKGRPCSVPMYYEEKLEELYPDLYEEYFVQKENKAYLTKLNEYREYARDDSINGSEYLDFLHWKAERNLVKRRLKAKQVKRLVRVYETED